jgi:hypothetical protein
MAAGRGASAVITGIGLTVPRKLGERVCDLFDGRVEAVSWEALGGGRDH